ncbi:MAG TPA: toxin-antitoxin system [Candidatus Binatia bacterium]|nr:toxin-antitoxin system [Candidatus Binatia bacterium]
MAQLLVRNLENSVKARLQRRAKRHGHSMEEEVRNILRDAANREEKPEYGLGTEIAALFPKTGPDLQFEKLSIKIKPPNFEK